jgi:hypothetical protein
MQIAEFQHFVITGETISIGRFLPQPRYSADRIQ